MGLFKYSVIEKEGEKTSKAQQHDINCSYKDLSQVFTAIKGLTVAHAELLLNEAIEMKRAIRYHKFATKIGHRSELGGKKGRYPKKECKIALDLIQNARANAIQKGMDESALYIIHAASYKQNVLKRYRNYFAGSRTLGYGKQAIWSNLVTCWAEVVLGEREVKEKKEATPTKVAAPKAKPVAKVAKEEKISKEAVKAPVKEKA